MTVCPRTHPRAVTRYALEGRVVTMDASYAVLERGVVYVEGNKIAAVVFTGAPPPPGFEGISAVGTRGTIYPGLIDLHNHVSYDALSLWDVPAPCEVHEPATSGAATTTTAGSSTVP